MNKSELERLREALRAHLSEADSSLVGDFEDAVRRDQAGRDADLMRKLSDRSPNTTPPKGGTNSRAVYASAAEILHPDQLGWSLSHPEHLR